MSVLLDDLADALVSRLGGLPSVAHVPMDRFHLAGVKLKRLGRADRMGAPDIVISEGNYLLLPAR